MPKTIAEILWSIAPVKRMSRETLYQHMRRNRIKPIGKQRQCPQLYPDDAAQRILRPLGLKITIRTAGVGRGRGAGRAR